MCNTVLGLARLFRLAIPLTAVLLAISIPDMLHGQAVTGTVIGTVQDATGAAVPGATVQIQNIAKGVNYQTTTNESGNYTQADVQPGPYTVTITKTGFQKYVQQNVAVTVGQSARVDATMQVGTETQEVTVSSAPPPIETDRAEVQTNLTAGQISELPVTNRNFTNLALLTPGSVINTFQHAPSENPQQSTLVNQNGQEFAGTNYQLDGMNNNDQVLGITMVNPAIDSVAEFTASTSNYDAEYHATGAVINVETRSGTNDLHGSAFEFLQNDVAEARNPFTQPTRSAIPELRWNQFGGSIGGPIKKDKLFFFGDAQLTRRRLGASEVTFVPTAQDRTGNFSDLLATGVQLYNPYTGTASGTGRTPFVGDIIPPSLIPAPITALLSHLPLPNIAAPYGAPNYAVSGVENWDSNQWDGRGDYYASEKLHLFGRYSYLQTDIAAPGPFGLYGGPAYGQLGFSGLSDSLNQNLASGGTFTVSPTFLTDFRFGFSRYRVTVAAQDQTTALASTLGFPGLNIPGRPDTNGMPDMELNGNLFTGFNCNCPLHERETVLDWTDNSTKIAGNHTIRFGVTWEMAWNLRLPSDQHRAGVYNFTPDITGDVSNPTSGYALASFLLGLPTDFNRFQQISTNQEDRQNRLFTFVQDTWRVTPKLTLSYGLRWDVWFPDFSLNPGQGGRYDVTNNIVYIPSVGGVSESGNAQTQWLNFSPRFGIAYAPNDKTVIRTGYGRGYAPGTFGWNFNDLDADVYPSIVNQSITQTVKFFPIGSVTTAPPPVVFPTIPSNGMLPLAPGIGVSYIPANQKIPYADQWSFTVEREIAPQLTLSLGYVGNVGRELNGGFNLNNAIPGPGSLLSREPLYAKFGLTQNIFDKCDCASSNYNGFQSQLTKRFSASYSLLASFSWQKSLDYGQFGTPTDQFNQKMDYGPSDYDREFVLTVAHTVQLPWGHGRRWLANGGRFVNGVFGDWAFRGITTWESGLPFSPTLNNTANLNSNMSERPDLIGNPLAGFTQSANLWFNPAAYGIPPLYTFGNAGRNSLRGPHYFTADWSLSKGFKFTERVGLEIRWEVFNVFNVTNLGLPGTAVDPGAGGGIISNIQTCLQCDAMRNMQFGAHITF